MSFISVAWNDEMRSWKRGDNVVLDQTSFLWTALQEIRCDAVLCDVDLRMEWFIVQEEHVKSAKTVE